MFSRLVLPCLLTSLTLLAGLRTWPTAGATELTPQPPAAAGAFHAELLLIAKAYKTFGRVDDDLRWSPEMCREPRPAVARFSKSGDTDTHGRKLYSLFAAKREEFLKLPVSTPVGQAIVKESWFPEEVPVPTVRVGGKDVPLQPGTVIAAPGRGTGNRQTDHFSPYAWKDGKLYKTGKAMGLFIMLKLDPKTPDTDHGWVYGTVTADGKTVTAAGRIESCMTCHEQAKHDRLFGLAAHTNEKTK